MDYTKVISTVKKYVLGIVDILENMRRAINQGTEDIKTDVAGVKTDVAGVKTDVAEVKQAITAANQLADQINGEVI